MQQPEISIHPLIGRLRTLFVKACKIAYLRDNKQTVSTCVGIGWGTHFPNHVTV